MDLKSRAKKLKYDIPAVFLALKHRDTPKSAKVLAAVTIGYALSPIDLIPDFIPILGYLDDIILLPALIALTVRLIPADIMEQCRAKAASSISGKLPHRWLYAIPILFLWLLAAYLIFRAVF